MIADKKDKLPDHLRHPYTKKKLKVIDCFSSPGRNVRERAKPPLSCSVCNNTSIDKVLVVESETPDGPLYYVMQCTHCDKYHWHTAGSATVITKSNV